MVSERMVPACINPSKRALKRASSCSSWYTKSLAYCSPVAASTMMHATLPFVQLPHFGACRSHRTFRILHLEHAGSCEDSVDMLSHIEHRER